MKDQPGKSIVIHGTVSPGFESVRYLYERNMRRLVEENTQLCVYYRSERVVDLWGSATGDREFSPDSITNVFSSSKNFEAIALAWLFDQGLVDYNAPVTLYWPEFGGAGKGTTTIADVMRHEGGLATFRKTLPIEDLLTQNIKLNRIGEIIEKHPQRFRKGADKQREYHAITRGWITNEIFRRIDPAGRTIGEFIRDQIAGPLNAAVVLGASDDDLARIVRLTAPSVGFHLTESLKPRAMGRRIEFSAWQGLKLIASFAGQVRNSTVIGAPPPLTGLRRITDFTKTAIARAEIPSANCNCSARGLATVAAMLANRGQWQGQQVLSENAWEAMHAAPIERDMGFHTTFTQGGVALFSTGPYRNENVRKLNHGRHGFYGWMGLGGSVFQWHPEHKIGFGYVPTSLFPVDIFNERGKAYQEEVLRCVERMN